MSTANETRPIIAYAVCTFGSPSSEIALDGIPEGCILPGHRRFRSEWAAHTFARQAIGTGSCTDARVAVLYDTTADPDISEGGGRGWEWITHRDARVEQEHAEQRYLEAMRACPGPVTIGDATVAIDTDGYLVVTPAHAVDGDTIGREWPAGVRAAQRLRETATDLDRVRHGLPERTRPPRLADLMPRISAPRWGESR